MTQQRDRLVRLRLHRHQRMLGKVLADARQVDEHRNAVLAQFVRRADARQHQELRRIVRAARQDHFARGGRIGRPALVQIFHADRAAILDPHLAGERVRDDREVLALHRRLEKRLRTWNGGGRNGQSSSLPARCLPVRRRACPRFRECQRLSPRRAKARRAAQDFSQGARSAGRRRRDTCSRRDSFAPTA